MRRKKVLRNLLAAVVLGMALLWSVSEVSAATVNISDYYLGYGSSTVSRMKKLRNKIGGMKVKRHKSYPTYFASGNKMTIGVKKAWSKVLIRNTGNKNVSILGVKIGMKKAAAVKKLTANYYRSYGGNNYWKGDAARIKLITKNGKVSRWEYLCEASG